MSGNPLLVVQQVFHVFVDQWNINIGLKPTLTLKTEENGAKSICSEVTRFMPEYSMETRDAVGCNPVTAEQQLVQLLPKKEAVESIQSADIPVNMRTGDTSYELRPQISQLSSISTSIYNFLRLRRSQVKRSSEII